MGSTIAPSNIHRSKTSFDDLPHETAVETFLKLPVKALVRATWVSKTWFSLISNPNFVSAQVRRSISCCDESAVLIVPTDISIPDRKYCSLISTETGSVIDRYEIPFNTRSGTLKLIGSVNGLLFFIDRKNKDERLNCYLWNPSVRKYKSLDLSCLDNRTALGFGFHEPSHDYRIIRVEYPADEERNGDGKLGPKVEVFSLQINQWRNIENPIFPKFVSGFGTTIDSIVYWIDNANTRTYLEEVGILSFDFNTEVFGKLKLPDDVRYCLGKEAHFNLMKFEGSLAVCVYNLNCLADESNELSMPCCIWLMKQEDGIISWTIRFKVVLNKVGWPYGITRNGRLIMFSISCKNFDRSILSYDLKSMHYKYLVHAYPMDKKVLMPATVDTCFIESLVMHVGRDELFK